MPIVDSRFVHQRPNPFYVPEPPVYVDLSQFTPFQPPPPPSLIEIIAKTLALAAAGYVFYKLFFEPEPQQRRCSACGSKSHNIARCPHVGERQHFSSDFEKTGWCECCGYQFPKTQLHHYGGRADNSKAKEMCRPCHLHCGHGGHWGNFAINPRSCRVAA
jgi:hypothetical protein